MDKIISFFKIPTFHPFLMSGRRIYSVIPENRDRNPAVAKKSKTGKENVSYRLDGPGIAQHSISTRAFKARPWVPNALRAGL